MLFSRRPRRLAVESLETRKLLSVAPMGVDDAYTMLSNQQLGANVMANDVAGEGASLSVSLIGAPSHGTLALGSDGLFTYKPESGFDGQDSFTYQLSDGLEESSPATVRIAVAPATPNRAPSAADDSYRTLEDQPLSIERSGVLGNDADPDRDTLDAVLLVGPRNGTLVLGPDGSFDYTPNANFNGVDSFTYKATDRRADSEPATVTIAVDPVNDTPVASADSYSMDQDQVLSLPASGVLSNDLDADGDALAAALVTGPSNGTLTLNADGSFEYAPNADFSGTDSFSYKANDGAADSNEATVTITVNRVNTAPTAADDSYSTGQDQALSVPANGVLANDLDADGDALAVALVTGPSNGTLTLNADGSFEYAPNAGFSGTDSFTYKTNDGAADSNEATVTITVNRVNTAPTAADDSYSTGQDQALSVPANGVLGNDLDAEGDVLTAALVTGPSNGTLTLNADGSFEYAPNAGFSGTDSFSYKANDAAADSNEATVTITVNPLADPPAKEMKIDLTVSSTPFGEDAGPTWGGSTFWVNAYVEDLRELPLGVVGGAVDLQFDAAAVTPTGNVVYGSDFTDYRQGDADSSAGLIDEAGALTTQGNVGAGGMARFVSWQFRRAGPGAPNDANGPVTFTLDPSEGAGTITPGNFALVGLGTPVAWDRIELDSASLNLSLGDFNGDGAVNQCDLALWIPHRGSADGQPGFDPRFDLNADARTDQADLDLLMPRLYRPAIGVAPAATPAASSQDGHATHPHHGPKMDLDWVGSGRHHGPASPRARCVDALFQHPDWRIG